MGMREALCDSESAIEYLALLGAEFINISELFTMLGRQFLDFGRDAALILDENRRLDMAITLAGLAACSTATPSATRQIPSTQPFSETVFRAAG